MMSSPQEEQDRSGDFPWSHLVKRELEGSRRWKLIAGSEVRLPGGRLWQWRQEPYSERIFYVCRERGLDFFGPERICKLERIRDHQQEARDRIDWLNGLDPEEHASKGLWVPLDAGCEDDPSGMFTWEVYPLLEHRSLADCLASEWDVLPFRSFGGNILLEVARQAAGGLQTLHEFGYAHLDVKASNLFVLGLEPELKLMVGDFGFSRGMDKPMPLARGRKSNMGPDSKCTAAADAWSLGYTLLSIFVRLYCPEDVKDFETSRGRERREAWFRWIGRMPADSQDLVFHLLADRPDRRPSMKDVKAWRYSGRGAFPVHTLFPGITLIDWYSSEVTMQRDYPQDFVRDFLGLPPGERPDFFRETADNYRRWVTGVCREPKEFSDRFKELGSAHGAAPEEGQRSWLLHKACFLMDPACPLIGEGIQHPPQSLGELGGLVRTSYGNPLALRGLRDLLKPDLLSPSHNVESLLELWMECTLVKRSYWRELIVGSQGAAAAVLTELRHLLELVNGEPVTREKNMLRLMSLRLALENFAEPVNGIRPLEVKGWSGVIQWDHLDEDAEMGIADEGELARFLLSRPVTGDHLRRSGLLALWLETGARLRPEEALFAWDSPFHDARPDPLLTLLLAWELVLRTGGEETALIHHRVEQAFRGDGGVEESIPWDAWCCGKPEWLAQLAECCEWNHGPSLFVAHLRRLAGEVSHRYGPVTGRVVLPAGAGKTGRQGVTAGMLMVCLAMFPQFSLAEALALLAPASFPAAWWRDFTSPRAAGQWMLREGNAELADNLRRSGALMIWILARAASAPPGGETWDIMSGLLLKPEWMKDGCDPELTTSLAVLLAGEDAPYGPRAELKQESRHGDSVLLPDGDGKPHSAPSFRSESMPTGQGTRKEGFVLRNAETDFPGILRGSIRILDNNSIFGDPLREGERAEFRTEGRSLEFEGNRFAFFVPLNTSRGLVQRSMETARLELEYNLRGIPERSVAVIQLECPVRVNHRGIWAWTLGAAAVGAMLSGAMGWWLNRIISGSPVHEPRPDGALLAGRVESGAEHWWRRWHDRPLENQLPWGGAIEPHSDPVPMYFEQSLWGLIFAGLVLASVLLVIWPRRPRIPSKD